MSTTYHSVPFSHSFWILLGHGFGEIGESFRLVGSAIQELGWLDGAQHE
jgi:hypothetical protein